PPAVSIQLPGSPDGVDIATYLGRFGAPGTGTYALRKRRNQMTLTASIVGGSGYTGGELLRLLLGHPEVEVKQVTSRSLAGKFVTVAHPNMRGHTKLKFVTPDELEPCDVIFVCVPHGSAASQAKQLMSLAKVVIDLSADFRLN